MLGCVGRCWTFPWDTGSRTGIQDRRSWAGEAGLGPIRALNPLGGGLPYKAFVPWSPVDGGPQRCMPVIVASRSHPIRHPSTQLVVRHTSQQFLHSFDAVSKSWSFGVNTNLECSRLTNSRPNLQPKALGPRQQPLNRQLASYRRTATIFPSRDRVMQSVKRLSNPRPIPNINLLFSRPQSPTLNLRCRACYSWIFSRCQLAQPHFCRRQTLTPRGCVTHPILD